MSSPCAARRAQAHLQALYQIDPGVDVTRFMVDRQQRRQLEAALGPLAGGREALWITEGGDGLSVALFIDDDLRHADVLDAADLDRHSALLEGISHLLYVLDRAGRDQPLTQLELELQAEVDKFLTTWRAHHEARAPLAVGELLARLFDRCHIHAQGEAARRYRAANRLARRYCHSLYRRFLRPDRLEPMWREVRRFWRMGQAAKIALIESA